MLNFKRKVFIKDLYDSKKTLDSFDWIQFESLKIFGKCILNELFKTFGKILEIFIYNKEEYIQIIKIIKDSNIVKKSNVCIRVFSKELTDFIINNYNCKHDVILDFVEYFQIKQDTNKNFVKIIRINRNNYQEKLNDIQREALKTSIKLFKLEFDYKSFEDISIKELEELQYWINQVRILSFYDVNFKRISIVEKRKFFKKIFVSNKLILYTDEKQEGWNFNLGLYLNYDGETLDYIELNKLKGYVNLTRNSIVSFLPIRNWFLVDYSQHTFLNNIPLITSLIDRWLYAKY